MNIAREILYNVQTITNLIDSFAKRYKINENDHTFRWLRLMKLTLI